MPEETTYDAVILIDPEPEPNFPPAYCESFFNSGIMNTDLFQEGRLKLTPKTRSTLIELPIYEDCHKYYCVAKVDSLCNTDDKRRAVRALNDYLELAKKAGRKLKDAVKEIVDLYPARVLKGFNFEKQNEPLTRLGSTNRFQKNFSCTETDGDGPRQMEQAMETGNKRNQKQHRSQDLKRPKKTSEEKVDIVVRVNDHPLPAPNSLPLHEVAVELPNSLDNVPVIIHMPKFSSVTCPKRALDRNR